MRLLVCGGRKYGAQPEEVSHLRHTLNRYAYEYVIDVVIVGGATGADLLAEVWAKSLGIKVRRFDADWATHGKAAGPIRNQRMLDEGNPSLVIAFPGNRGTADMVRRAKAAGVEVILA